MANNLPFELQRFGYRELEAAGYGSRTTIWRKCRAGKFPEPVTEPGEPCQWTGQQLLEINKRSGAAA